MKITRRIGMLLSTAMVALLGVCSVQAQTVIVDPGGTNATAIRNLDVDGMLFDVDFVFGDAETVYGGRPPTFDFNSGADAIAAVDAATAALNGVPTVETVGQSIESAFFNVGYEWDVPIVAFVGSSYDQDTDTWSNTGSDFINDGSESSYAVFTEVSVAPTLDIAASGPNEITVSWTPDTPGFVLQESTNLTTNVWINASSGTTNPITLPAIQDAMFYRVVNP
jgi:hypothetical protein